MDRTQVNIDNDELNLKHMITVYGFSQDAIMMHKTCNFDITMKENEAGQVTVEMSTSELVGKKLGQNKCLHRDKVPLTIMEEETQNVIRARDDQYF